MNKYKNNFEVYLISDLNGVPLYAGQGKAFVRAQKHKCPSYAIKFNKLPSEIKILYRVIVATKQEALDLEEKFIEKFNPPFNNAKRGNMVGVKHSDITKLKIGNASKNRSIETLEKIGISTKERNLGSHHSEETKNKISLKIKEYWANKRRVSL